MKDSLLEVCRSSLIATCHREKKNADSFKCVFWPCTTPCSPRLSPSTFPSRRNNKDYSCAISSCFPGSKKPSLRFLNTTIQE